MQWVSAKTGDEKFVSFEITMSELMGVYGYRFRELVQARVISKNIFGLAQDYSTPNRDGARIRILPIAIPTVFVNPELTSTS